MRLLTRVHAPRVCTSVLFINLMHQSSGEVYLHPYCLVVTRLDKMPGVFFQPQSGVEVTQQLSGQLGMLVVFLLLL